MGFFSFLSAPCLGLSIQAEEIKLIQLKKRRSGFIVERAASCSLTSTLFAEDKQDSWTRLSHELAKLVQAWKIKAAAVVINIPAQLVRMQHICLPPGLSAVEIETEISLKIQKELRGMREELSIDFVKLEKLQNGYTDIYFAAAPQKLLSRYSACIQAASLVPQIIDIDIYALHRMANFANAQIDANVPNALVFASANMARLIIFNHVEIVFHRQWHFVDSVDCYQQLKFGMRLYAANASEVMINTLFLCTEESILQPADINIEECGIREIDKLNLFERIEFSPDIPADLIEKRSEFLLAMGAAIRSVSAC